MQHVPALLVLGEVLLALSNRDEEHALGLLAGTHEGLLHLWAHHFVQRLRKEVVKKLCKDSTKVVLKDLIKKLGFVYILGHGHLPTTTLGQHHEVLVPRSVGEEVGKALGSLR